MTEDQRRSERERREAALAAAGSGVEPGAREVPPARMKQMLSLRMEPELDPRYPLSGGEPTDERERPAARSRYGSR